MKKIEKINPSGIFTNYIYKTIPLAFDESMSYYEMLCGILDRLKTDEDVINNNADLLAELENYVKHYFDNLDIQEEINNKLDEMVEDGTLAQVINEQLFTDLNNQVETNSENITSLQNQINAINTNFLTELVVFGDSWSDPDVDEAIWPTFVADELRLNLHNYAKNGAGYVLPSNNLIETQLTTAVADTSYAKGSVKYVVFEGGINDYRLGVTMLQLRAKIVELYASAKLIFPNAKIIYVNNFQYPYNQAQSEFWYKLQYSLGSYKIQVLNQDGFFTSVYFVSANMFHLTTAGQGTFASNIVSALSGGQIKNEGVFIDFDNNKGYLYVRRDDNSLNYYILFDNLVASDQNIPTTQALCWPEAFDNQFLGSISLGYIPSITDFDNANQRIKIAREDTSLTKVCFNGSLSLNIR